MHKLILKKSIFQINYYEHPYVLAVNRKNAGYSLAKNLFAFCFFLFQLQIPITLKPEYALNPICISRSLSLQALNSFTLTFQLQIPITLKAESPLNLLFNSLSSSTTPSNTEIIYTRFLTPDPYHSKALITIKPTI